MAYTKEIGGDADKMVDLINKGDSIEGFYLGCKEFQSKEYYNTDGTPKVSKLHIFKAQDGSTIGTWGKSYLNGLMKPKHVGYQCLVEMTGMVPPKKKGRKPAYGYELQVDWDKKISASPIEVDHEEDTSFDPNEIESYAKTSNNRR
jgi:hypothetical protein